jgi:hypothetical protein
MAQRKKKPTHYYLLRDIDYVSKEEIWSYVPNKVLLIFSSEDIEKIKYLTEY